MYVLLLKILFGGLRMKVTRLAEIFYLHTSYICTRFCASVSNASILILRRQIMLPGGYVTALLHESS